MNCLICDMELEMDEKGDGRCDHHRYLTYFTAKDLAQAAALRARLIAGAVKPSMDLIRHAVADRIDDDWLKAARDLIEKTNH